MDILLVGPSKSGKTSIQKVVFQKLSPHESFFLPATNKIDTFTVENNKNVKFTINDFPGDKTFDAVADRAILEKAGAIIYVFDAQIGELEDSCVKLRDIIAEATKVNKNIYYEVFIHKVDSDMYTTDDQRTDVYNEFQREIRRELKDENINVNISFYMTSIYDHSVFDALSKIVQKLFPFVEHLIAMLDSLHSSCGVEKAFIFDIVSKIFIATDSSPVDIAHYEICSELIDVLIDMSCIYGKDNLKFDEDSSTTIKLKRGDDEESGHTYLYLKEVDDYLALVCLIGEEEFQKKHLINYNINLFKESLQEIFAKK
jgi:Ras-related GTP-binding protein C/D